MNRILLFALGGVLVLGGQANGFLLSNGDLELPPGEEQLLNDWQVIEPAHPDPNVGGVVDTVSFPSFANRADSGGAKGLWFRAFMGGASFSPIAVADATVQQAVPANAGEEYTLSAWSLYEEFYAGLNPFENTQTLLALDFLDAGDAVIGGVELDVDTVQAGDATWRQHVLSDTAPVGTVSVRARVEMVGGIISPSNPQSAFFDDFVLTPEPTSLILLLPALTLLRRR